VEEWDSEGCPHVYFKGTKRFNKNKIVGGGGSPNTTAKSPRGYWGTQKKMGTSKDESLGGKRKTTTPTPTGGGGGGGGGVALVLHNSKT